MWHGLHEMLLGMIRVSAEAKARKQEEHGAITPTAGRTIVVDGQHTLHFLPGVRRDGSEAYRPCGGAGAVCLSTHSDCPSEHQKAQKRADGDRRQLATSPLSPRGFLTDKGRDHGRRGRRPVGDRGAKTGGDEASDKAPIALTGAQGYGRDLRKVDGIVREPLLARRGWEHGLWWAHHAVSLQESEEMAQTLGRFREVPGTVPPEPSDIALEDSVLHLADGSALPV